MGHTFETDGPFGPENLEAEPRSGCCHRSQVTGHSVFHSKKYRSRIVTVDLNGTPETLTVHMIYWTTQVNHPVDSMHAHRREPTTRRFLSMRPPLGWFEQQSIGKRHCGFHMQDRSKPARTDAITQFCHFRMEAAVVAESQGDAGLASCLN